MICESVLDMRAALPEGGVLLGLDTGTKTIGLALCDPLWRFATAGKTIRRSKFAADKAQLQALIRMKMFTHHHSSINMVLKVRSHLLHLNTLQ